jgi:hypothetical protein
MLYAHRDVDEGREVVREPPIEVIGKLPIQAIGKDGPRTLTVWELSVNVVRRKPMSDVR